MTLQYCKKCILPDSRPNLEIDSAGNCNCSFGDESSTIDWEARKKQFADIVDEIKAMDRQYDCLIPVSGGKDSTWQVLKALEVGLKPLCVTWRTPARNKLGQRNLNNLISLGVDHIDVSVNPKVEKAFTLKAFEKFGSPAIPMHMAIHAIPMNVALEKNIPIILWGENSATEYGGDAAFKGTEITRAWLEKYGVTFGTTAESWVSDSLSIRDLGIYKWPSEDELRQASVRAIFLGEFYKWDPRKTAKIAKEYGFEEAQEALVGQYTFADVDDAFLMAIHHWMKWYKFGITRSWDNLSLDIRAGVLSREKALQEIKRIGDETPYEAISAFCDYVGISQARFFEIAEQFRNPNIWIKKNGLWVIEDFILTETDWRMYEV
ncbi:MAG: N-acetyl sugar amidotransferase [Oceanospirillaceae bacterium]|nr:N-acetyl sugar amidotransferase [Oceanospirillaceae bacterium]